MDKADRSLVWFLLWLTAGTGTMMLVFAMPSSQKTASKFDACLDTCTKYGAKEMRARADGYCSCLFWPEDSTCSCTTKPSPEQE